MIQLSRLRRFATVAIPCAVLSTFSLSNTALAGPKLAIVIDDIGYGTWPVERSLALPAGVSLGVFPGLKNSDNIAEKAHASGHEVLLHVPMQPQGGSEKLNPGTLRVDQGREAFVGLLISHLQSVPFAKGISNHQGSLLTAEATQMGWVMETISSWGNLYFLDSRTTKFTVAQQAAAAAGVANARRHVFLDNIQTEAAVRESLMKAVALARKNGSAVAIGHPNAATLSVLEQELPQLIALGIELVPVSAIATTNPTGSVRRATTTVFEAPAKKGADIVKTIAVETKAGAEQPTNSNAPIEILIEGDIYSDVDGGQVLTENPDNQNYLDALPLAKTYPIATPQPPTQQNKK